MSDKDLDMVEERIKRATKSKPASARVVIPEEKPKPLGVRPQTLVIKTYRGDCESVSN